MIHILKILFELKSCIYSFYGLNAISHNEEEREMKKKDYHFTAEGSCTNCRVRWPLGTKKCSCKSKVKDLLFIQEIGTLAQLPPVDLILEHDLDRIMQLHFVKRTNKRMSGLKTTLRMHPMWFWNIMYRYPSWTAAKKAAFANTT